MRARPVAVLVLTLGLAAAARAQGLSISLGAGGFVPSEKAYRDIYGSGALFAADLWLQFRGPFGISAGFSRFADRGTAVALGEGEEEYPLKFRRQAIPVTATYRWRLKALDILFGAGVCFHQYEETWETVDLGFEGRRTSPRLYAMAGYALLSRVSIFGSVIYDSIRTGAESLLSQNVNLGGVQFLAGLAVRIY